MTEGWRLGVGNPLGAVTERLFEPTLRLGVTGLSRAGKTVFITALVANLLNRGRMLQLRAESESRIDAAYLQPQPDLTLPRFDYETHLAAILGHPPRWPESTRTVSELRLSFRSRPSGLLAGLGLRGPQVLHLDIVDYPGEWLLDLSLLAKSFRRWSEEVLARLDRRPDARTFLAHARAVDAGLPHDEAQAQALAASYTAMLRAAKAQGRTDGSPGRFLLPGELEGSPVLTFAPLPPPADPRRGSLWTEMQRRFEAYKDRVALPFFRDHFARIDRQVVLVDVLSALHDGPAALEDLRRAMADILAAFRVGRSGWLARVFGARKVEKILFAATKADHLHHEQHGALTAITEALLAEAKDRARFAGAETAAIALAGLRTTVEEMVERDGARVPSVRGRLLASGKEAVMFAGRLPEDPARVIQPARGGAERWLDAEFSLMAFAPAPLRLKPGDGPPHIRLDRAAEFLIGDRL